MTRCFHVERRGELRSEPGKAVRHDGIEEYPPVLEVAVGACGVEC